jgi:hypothetical protein
VDKIILHPQAQNLLFKYYRDLRLIFNDVLGHLEIDYISMALLDDKNQLILFSSMPSIEQNLLLKDFWQQDLCLQKAFFNQDSVMIWNHAYDDIALHHFKLAVPKLAFALSIPERFQDFKVSYSFGVKSQDPAVHLNLLDNQSTLKAMAKYCLINILRVVHPDNISHLKLIVSNDL